MKTTFATIGDILNGKECPLPLDIIPNSLGISLCAVDAISWTKQADGQLVNLNIHFKPEQLKEQNQAPIANKFDEYLRTNYFCGGNLKTRKNPRIDLMFNCEDFWFADPDNIVPVFVNVLSEHSKKDCLISNSGAYYGSTARKIPEILSQLIQSEIIKNSLADVNEIVSHLTNISTPQGTLLFQCEGCNHIRVKTTTKSQSIRL